METISPDHQSSPPLTKFNITITPHQHILPPLKSLPSWNRTKFGVRKPTESVILKSVNRRNPSTNLIKSTSEQTEQFTQTSPLSSRQSSSSSTGSRRSLKVSTPIAKRKAGLKTSYEKKIIFLQSAHSETLTDLHREVEQLKEENKGNCKKFFIVFVYNQSLLSFFSFKVIGFILATTEWNEIKARAI